MPPQTHQLGLRLSMPQNRRVHQIIVKHHIGLTQALHASQSNQSGIPRSGANEKNLAGRVMGLSLFCHEGMLKIELW